MANEITVTCSITVRKGNGSYQNFPNSFKATLNSNYNGPTPSAVTASTQHTTISFSQLTSMGGICFLYNTDPTNFVEWGLYDPATNLFHAMGELLPGEFNFLRLSRYLGQEVRGQTGTGTSGHGKLFCLKADVAPCVVLVDAFDP